jgi:hypothetical protein
MQQEKIALLLRGHVRESLDNKTLYNFLCELVSKYNVDIYVYTFNIKSSGKIYKINEDIDKKKISEEDIKNYFGDLMKYTKKIIIDEESMADLTNDRNIGNISKNKFLHMWKSIFNIIKYVKEEEEKEEEKEINNKYKYIINMRIDYFELTNKFLQVSNFTNMKRLFYIDLIKEYLPNININDDISLLNIINNSKNKTNFYKNNMREILINKKREKILQNIRYDENDILYGIDNVFAGKLDYLYKLAYVFVNNIDDVFDFLEEIYNGLSEYSKLCGGCGGPHEAILPLFIKNKLQNYL